MGIAGTGRLTLFFTFFAIQLSAEKKPPSFLRQHPRSTGHGRLMPHMLAMSTAKIGHPMTFFILVIPDNVLLHDGSFAFLCHSAD